MIRGVWRFLPNLRACPLSVDLPLYRQKPSFQNRESRQTIRQLPQLPTGGTSAFGGLRATASLQQLGGRTGIPESPAAII